MVNVESWNLLGMELLHKVGNNDFWLELSPYMQMYFIVNVENLKLYEPPMIVDQYVQV